MPAADRLAMEVTAPDGYATRWGPDEIEASLVTNDLVITDSLPGGHKTLDCGLTRRPDRVYADLNLYDDVLLYAPGLGNEDVWNGRQNYFPKKQGADFGIDVNAVGYAASMDDKPFQEIIVDRDLGVWKGASAQRRLDLAASWNMGDPTVVPDVSTGVPGLKLEASPPWNTGGWPHLSAYYDASGVEIASLYYAWKTSIMSATWNVSARLADDDRSSNIDSSAELHTGAPPASGTGTVSSSLTTPKFFCEVAAYFGSDVPAGTDDNKALFMLWTALAVYGTHGLTKRGSGSSTVVPGFYADDVIRWLIDNKFPQLSYTRESIDDASDFVLQQLAWREPTKGSDAVALINGYFWRDWGVWNKRVFHWHEPDPTNYDWEVRQSDGARYVDTGETADDLVNGVIVLWRDAAGVQHRTTPDDDASLLDTSPSNPCNKAGIERWGILQFDKVTTADGAVKAGVAWLTVYSRRRHRGTLELTGWVRHRTRGLLPAYMVRSGDWVYIADDEDDAYRKVVNKTYRRAARTAELELDNRSYRLEAMFEQLGVVIVDIVGGS